VFAHANINRDVVWRIREPISANTSLRRVNISE